MKKLFSVLVICIAVSSLLVAGCGMQKEESPRKAIDMAKTLQTTQEKADYLIGQAKAFYNSKDFQGAVDIAQYILRYLDKDSTAAKDLLEKAKEQLKAQAQSAVDSAKKNFGM